MRQLYRLFFTLALTVACSVEAFAQLGNEWINFSQSYYKIPVAKEGIYKLAYADLQAAGFPVASVDPTRIQLFHRGKEQTIYIEGQDDNQFNPTDFIEFYGLKNDGTMDKDLYQFPSSQPHKLYNLYNDTTSYFLTVSSLAGKRMASFNEANTGGLAPEGNHTDEQLMILVSQYSAGVDYGEVQLTTGDEGEGWTGNQIVQTQSIDYTFTNIVQTVTTGAVPTLEMLVVGRGPMEHFAEVYVGASQRLAGTISFSGFASFKFNASLVWTDIAGDGTLLVRLKDVGVAGQPDRVSACYVKLNYPQRLNALSAAEKILALTPNVNDKSYIELENPSVGMRLFDITDPENLVKIGTTSTTTLNAVVPSTSTGRKLYATSTTLTPSIKPVNFRQIVAGQANYIVIAHPHFRTPALGYSDPVKAYAAYRASAEGGAYDTLVVNVQQLYDQFNYGETSPTAIYHFMKFLTSAKVPKYLLLVGKGLDVYYQYYRNQSNPAFAIFKDYVPSAGFPGSDIAYTAGLAGSPAYEPAVPTGRIPALKAEDVSAYLNKVIEMEAVPYNSLWRKNVLHLSGGINEGEPQLFKSYLQDFQVVAEDYYLGGKVSAVAKHSKEIQQINVAAQVNAGLNLMTFFGHSSATTTDFEIGYATDPLQGYNNKGKYPVLLMNGCNAGSFFLAYSLSGEDWVVAKDRGSVGFIGHSAYGFTSLLKEYSQTFYNVGYHDTTYITKGLGDIQKETVNKFLGASGLSAPGITQAQQMILLGDPAVKLFGARAADLEINDDNVSLQSFDDQPITIATDSFAITMIIRNFGQARKDTIRIEVERTLNDNSRILYDSLYPSPKYSDTLTFVIRKGREEGFGNNSFRISIDPDDVLKELTKENNTATKTLIIPLNGTKNLFPTNFGIVHSEAFNLSFQTTDLLSAEREFTIELDTTNTFDSPYKKQFTSKGTVLSRKEITILQLDTTAYYWRTKLTQPKPGESEQWTLSSFTYIKDGEDGWAQVHFPQYLTNQTEGLVKDAGLRKLKYLESVTPVSITTYGANHPAPFTDVSIKIANAEYNLYGPGYDCRDNSFNLVAFDRKSTVPYLGVKFEWYNRAGRVCGRKPWVINNYVPSQMATGNNDDLVQYVDNIQVGDSVIMYSMGDAGYSTWPAAAKNKLSELGVSLAQLNDLEDGEPVIIVGRKGIAPGTAVFYRADGPQKDLQVLSASKTITGGYTSGYMSSGLIGPALKWKALSSRATEIESVDEVSFDVVAVKLNGEEEVVLEQVTGNQDLAFIDAATYPYAKIVFRTDDETDLTSSQLNKWLVTFTPVPEGILLYKGVAEQEVINEGQPWQGSYGFVNVSDKLFPDSLTVRYELFNESSRVSQLQLLKIKAPLPGDTTSFAVHVNTLDKGGLNDVDVYVNPHLVPEQYYDNNLLQLTAHLNVQVETLHPVLDVTVDGRHLVNADFVSPNPLIVAKIWDENTFILKTDTTGVRVFLTYPCDQDVCAPQAILLTNQDVKWYAATSSSPFRIEFTPKGLVDGEYKLRVEAADARGNQSGVDPYEITFTVKNESTATILDPYPNPFSREVYFRIVVTGQTLPEEFGVQMINVNGQLQSHFQASDFSSFHSGTNEMVWDGRDSNGNTLPSGVYIYKLNLSVGGQQIQKIGKLVLVR